MVRCVWTKRLSRLLLLLALSFCEPLTSEAANQSTKANANKVSTKQSRSHVSSPNKTQKKQDTSLIKQPSSRRNQPQLRPTVKPQPEKLSGQGLYLRAREYFAAGRYAEAIKYAAAAQRRIPHTNLPSVLMAQSYYRLGMIPRAAKLFAQIAVNDLPKEAAVDYTLTMFAAGRYREVIKAYNIVPDNHPYKDVARFYTGVSLIQFKLYQKAQYFLRNSRKIPASLKSQKRRLLSELDDIIDGERRGQYDQSQAYPYQSPQIYIPPPPAIPEPQAILPGGGVSSDAPAKPPSPPPPPPGSSTTFTARPSLGWSQSTTRQDFNGFKQAEANEKSPTASLSLAVKFLGKARSFGGQPSVDLNLSPIYAHKDSIATSSSLVADSSSPDTIQNVATRVETSTYSLTNIYGIAGLYPISDPIDISAGYSEKHEYLKANSKNGIATRTANGKLVIELNSFKLDGSFNNDTVTNRLTPSKNKSTNTIKGGITRNGENTNTSFVVTMIENAQPIVDGGIQSAMSLDFSWIRNFEDFSLSIGANKLDRERIPFGGNGIAMSEMAGKLEGTYNMSFGISVVANAAYQTLSNFMVVNAAKDSSSESTEAGASGTAKKFSLMLKVSPASFASVNASYEYTDRALQTDDPAFEKKLATEHWSQQTVTKLGLTFSYSF